MYHFVLYDNDPDDPRILEGRTPVDCGAGEEDSLERLAAKYGRALYPVVVQPGTTCPHCHAEIPLDVRPELRPELRFFAREMERALRQHEHLPGWAGQPVDELFGRLVEEVDELADEIDTGDRERIIDAAADVANYAMMIADVLRTR